MIQDKEYLSRALGNPDWWVRQVQRARFCHVSRPVLLSYYRRLVCFNCACDDHSNSLLVGALTVCAQYERQAEDAHTDVTSVMIGDFGTIEGSQQRDIKYVIFNINELPESDSLQFGFPAQTAPKACVRVTCRFQKQRGHLNQEGQLYT